MPSTILSQHVGRRLALTHLGGGGLPAALITQDLGSVLAQDATPAAGTTEANRAIVLRVFDAVNDNTPEVVYELYAPDFVDRSAFPDQIPGPAGIEQAIVDFNAILPDITVTVDSIIAEGDQVATREIWQGTDPSSGQVVMGTTLHFWHIEDGMIVEEWSAGWEWLAQIGAAATPASGG